MKITKNNQEVHFDISAYVAVGVVTMDYFFDSVPKSVSGLGLRSQRTVEDSEKLVEKVVIVWGFVWPHTVKF